MKRIASLVLGTFAASVASAGVYVEMVEKEGSTGKTKLQQKMYVQGNKGRFVDDDGNASIIKDGTLYIIDDKDKSYLVFDKAAMESLAKQLNAAMEQMKEQLAKLPPEQRAQVEQMLGQQMPGLMDEGQKWTVEVVDTGKSDKVDGRTCKLWDVKRNGALDEQVCVVPYNALPGKENFQEVFATFAKVFEEMAKSVPQLAGAMTKEFDAQVKVNGFPVRTRQYDNGKLTGDEQVMQEWREENFPASTFDVPAGYRRKSIEEMAN